MFLDQNFVSIHPDHKKPGMQQQQASSLVLWISSKTLSTLIWSYYHLCHVVCSSGLIWLFSCLTSASASASAILWIPLIDLLELKLRNFDLWSRHRWVRMGDEGYINAWNWNTWHRFLMDELKLRFKFHDSKVLNLNRLKSPHLAAACQFWFCISAKENTDHPYMNIQTEQETEFDKFNKCKRWKWYLPLIFLPYFLSFAHFFGYLNMSPSINGCRARIKINKLTSTTSTNIHVYLLYRPTFEKEALLTMEPNPDASNIHIIFNTIR